MNSLTYPKMSFTFWLGLLGPPTIWLISLLTSYLLVLYVCKGGPHFTLHLAAIIFLSLAAGAIVLSWVNFKSIPQTSENEDMVVRSRRFLANVSILVSVLFFLVILAQTIPIFILDPCVF